MANFRIPKALCARVADALTGSHAALDALFRAAGAPEPPPDLAHHSKWKTWIFQAGTNPDVDSLQFLGNFLEEFMDIAPSDETDQYIYWIEKRDGIVEALDESGLRYYRGGRVMPNESPEIAQNWGTTKGERGKVFPSSIDELLTTLVRGLPRAMHPLTHRRKGSPILEFASEYDVQDLLHALLRPWVGDVRPEEFTPSYAGTSTRMDFLLPAHSIVIELKFVRDRSHGKRIGDELIIDIEHYRRHPACRELWCVIYDPLNHLQNQEGLRTDLEGERTSDDGLVNVRVSIL